MTAQSRKRIEAIESWFRDKEDGEFVTASANHPSVVGGVVQEARTVIYTTKQHCLPRIIRTSRFPTPIATIARGGLPAARDMALLDDLAQETQCVFFGDADPPDVLVFAWLTEHVPMKWCGVTDDWLGQHGDRDLGRRAVSLSEAEKATVPVLADLAPGFREWLGPYCSSLLDSGYKIELEGGLVWKGEYPGQWPPRSGNG